MKKARIAINGFGRIGRVFLRAALQREDIEIVAVNDLSDLKTSAHLFKYDSVHGIFSGSIEVQENGLNINGHSIQFLSERQPDLLPWKSLDIDFVLESTGIFKDSISAGKHLQAGAKRVVLSAPPKDDAIKTYVFGVNHDQIEKDELILSNASCTTNSCAHILQLIDENWGIESGFLNTVHAYTADQNLQDAYHSDLRRARAAANSIIPTSTGAAKALIKLFPHLNGHLKGTAVRVPVIDGSLTDLTLLLKKTATVQEVNQLVKIATETKLKGIVEFQTDPIVSVDIIGNRHSGIYDSLLCDAIGNMLKVVIWYDNETGYSSRCVDLISYVHSQF